MSATATVLLISPHPTDHKDLLGLLEGAGMSVALTSMLPPMAAPVHEYRPDVTVLDTGVPLAGGGAVVHSLQEASECGIIMLCPKADAVACILGLEMGADDVVERSRDPREIAARIHRLINRARQLREQHQSHKEVEFSGWRLSLERRELARDGARLHLTRGEFDLLATLACRPGKVMTRDQLLDHICNREWAPSDRTVDVLVNRLRHRIGENPREPRHLVTVHGIGYVFNP